MAQFTINFRVEQILSGSITVTAENIKEAVKKFKSGGYDEQRLNADLDLNDSEDSIIEVYNNHDTSESLDEIDIENLELE